MSNGTKTAAPASPVHGGRGKPHPDSGFILCEATNRVLRKEDAAVLKDEDGTVHYFDPDHAPPKAMAPGHTSLKEEEAKAADERETGSLGAAETPSEPEVTPTPTETAKGRETASGGSKKGKRGDS